MTPLASVVVLNWNGGKSFQKCIRSVQRQDYDNTEIIAVDNASTDGSEQYAVMPRQATNFRLIINDQNRGAAGGYNLGYANAKGKYVILIAHDSILRKDCVRKLVEAMEADPRLGCAEGECIHPGIGVLNGNITPLMYGTSLPDWVTRKFYPGLPVIIRRSIMPRYTDSDYFFYGEDVYCGWMAHIKGYECKRILGARLMHEGSPTVKRNPKLYRYYDERNRWLNILLFYESRTLVTIIPKSIGFSLARIVHGLKTGFFWSSLKANLWVLTHIGTIRAKRRVIQAERVMPDSCIVEEMCREKSWLLGEYLSAKEMAKVKLHD